MVVMVVVIPQTNNNDGRPTASL